MEMIKKAITKREFYLMVGVAVMYNILLAIRDQL